MILVDKLGHMVSTESEDELHTFAQRLELKRSWYQNTNKPHYDLTTRRKINLALKNGAKLVRSKDIVRQAWWKEQK